MENSGTRGRPIWVHSSQVVDLPSVMEVYNRPPRWVVVCTGDSQTDEQEHSNKKEETGVSF